MCEAEGRAIRRREFVRAIDRTHQARLVVKRKGKEDVTDLVGEHTSESTCQLSIVHRIVGGTCVSPFDVNPVRPPELFGLVLEAGRDDSGGNRTIDPEVNAYLEGLTFMRVDSLDAAGARCRKEGRELVLWRHTFN